MATFKVTFTELPGEVDARAPGSLGKLIAGASMGRMFRWGAISPFIDRAKELVENPPIKATDMVELYNDLKIRMVNIKGAAQARGYSRSATLEAIGSDDRAILRKIHQTWDRLFKEDEPQQLRAVMESADRDKVLEMVGRVDDLSRDYLTICLRNLPRLAAAELASDILGKYDGE